MRSRGTFLPRSTFSKNGSTSALHSGPPNETSRIASYFIRAGLTLLLQLRQGGQHLFAVLVDVGVQIGIDLHDLSFGTDDEGGPLGILDQTHVGQRTVLLGNLVIGVRQQLEGQSFLGAELLVRFGVVNADA